MIEVMKKGGFNFTKFKGNYVEVLKTLISDKYEYSEQQLKIDCDQVWRILGTNWEMQDHCFIFTRNTATNCRIRSRVSPVFDPLWFVTLFTLKVKLLNEEMSLRDVPKKGRTGGRSAKGNTEGVEKVVVWNQICKSS